METIIYLGLCYLGYRFGVSLNIKRRALYKQWLRKDYVENEHVYIGYPTSKIYEKTTTLENGKNDVTTKWESKFKLKGSDIEFDFKNLSLESNIKCKDNIIIDEKTKIIITKQQVVNIKYNLIRESTIMIASDNSVKYYSSYSLFRFYTIMHYIIAAFTIILWWIKIVTSEEFIGRDSSIYRPPSPISIYYLLLITFLLNVPLLASTLEEYRDTITNLFFYEEKEDVVKEVVKKMNKKR